MSSTHNDTPFNEQKCDPQPCTAQHVGDELVLHAVCPICLGQSNWPIDRAWVGGDKPDGHLSNKDAAQTESTDGILSTLPPGTIVECTCGFDHQGRPDNMNQLGCGAYWVAEGTPDAPGS